jgi:hypothetical protein
MFIFMTLGINGEPHMAIEDRESPSSLHSQLTMSTLPTAVTQRMEEGKMASPALPRRRLIGLRGPLKEWKRREGRSAYPLSRLLVADGEYQRESRFSGLESRADCPPIDLCGPPGAAAPTAGKKGNALE